MPRCQLSNTLSLGLRSKVGCVLALVGCEHALAGCVHALAGCVLALAGCVHALVGCVHALAGCVHALAGCVHALAGCVLALAGCVLALVGCVHHLPPACDALTMGACLPTKCTYAGAVDMLASSQAGTSTAAVCLELHVEHAPQLACGCVGAPQLLTHPRVHMQRTWAPMHARKHKHTHTRMHTQNIRTHKSTKTPTQARTHACMSVCGSCRPPASAGHRVTATGCRPPTTPTLDGNG
eukprot:363208-Chlamydomonas_euryale.AAC.5